MITVTQCELPLCSTHVLPSKIYEVEVSMWTELAEVKRVLDGPLSFFELASFHGWFNQPTFTGQVINIDEEIRSLRKDQRGSFQLSNGFVEPTR